MSSKRKISTFKRRLKRFEVAVDDYAFIGASDPEIRDAIEIEYEKAKECILKTVEDLK